MTKNKDKGFCIVYIPLRGGSRSFFVPSFVIYALSLCLIAALILGYQFFQHFTQLRTEYIKMNSFSMEEKQLIMSEELLAVQQVIEEIYPTLEKNKEKMAFISVEDHEVRESLNLKPLNLNPENFMIQPGRNRRNLGFYSHSQLSLMDTLSLKERAQDQSIHLDHRIDNLQIAKESAEIYETRLNQTPDIWPVPGGISSGYGYRRHPVYGVFLFHTGVDIGARHGYPIMAAAEGRVVQTGRLGGYGNVVRIYHRDGISTLYAHCSEVLVNVGDYVTKGSIIARVGSSGITTGPHLHYEVHVHDRTVDPESFYREGRISQ